MWKIGTQKKESIVLPDLETWDNINCFIELIIRYINLTLPTLWQVVCYEMYVFSGQFSWETADILYGAGGWGSKLDLT